MKRQHFRQPARPPGPRAAFSLIETLVAVLIFSVAVVALIEGIAGNTRLQAWYEDQEHAVMLAQNIMEEIEYVGDLRAGSDGGDFEGEDAAFSWASEILETDFENLFEVRVAVSWKEGEAQRDYQLVTYLRNDSSETSDTMSTETGSAMYPSLR